jgi:outer membrane protein
MKKFLLIIFCIIIFPLSAFSATLKEALKQTFDNNLELQAERKNLEIQQEVINMSRSDLLPTLTLTGKKILRKQMKLLHRLVQMHQLQM